ncbi:BTB domain-containing protein [Favolaschia claudopus]|uniref:BTB domain-containing protein n=1 Tax=Favolaschia claudopus TaxID=2862362 RepID=A0AAW0ELM0_9AGAR
MDVDSEQAPATDQGLTRAEGLYFEDCGLIIQAESTLFRISRDYLASQSPVFRDMLSLPPPKTADMMDGCPFVQLPDTAKDVTVFLKALMFCDFFEAHPVQVSFAIVIGVFRMSHKYEVDSLRKRALVHICAAYPTTLGEYDRLIASQIKPIWTRSPEEVDSFVLLARELSFDWILPVAFYQICEIVPESHMLSGPYELKDKVRLVTACRILEGSATSNFLQFLWPGEGNVSGCSSPARCREAKFHARQLAEEYRERIPNAFPALPLRIWEVRDWVHVAVCQTCLAFMKREHQLAKQNFWDNLPAMFDLPEWSELEKIKIEAFK